jgi:hypothetical protein
VTDGNTFEQTVDAVVTAISSAAAARPVTAAPR